MARYFFNIYDGDQVFDKIGTELASKRDVRLHMLATALAHVEEREHHREEWQMEALDERGRIVSTMAFGLEMDRY